MGTGYPSNHASLIAEPPLSKTHAQVTADPRSAQAAYCCLSWACQDVKRFVHGCLPLALHSVKPPWFPPCVTPAASIPLPLPPASCYIYPSSRMVQADIVRLTFTSPVSLHQPPTNSSNPSTGWADRPKDDPVVRHRSLGPCIGIHSLLCACISPPLICHEALSQP